jgi:hypothetical protein
LQPPVIDKFDNLNVKPEQANAFFRLIDQRYNRVSTIITTSLDLADWYELFEKKHLVDPLFDRLRHRCISINIDGPSLRSPEAHAASRGERRPARQSVSERILSRYRDECLPSSSPERSSDPSSDRD